MKQPLMILCLCVCICLSSGLAQSTASAQSNSGACTMATVECTERVTFPGGSAYSLIYTTYPLDSRNQSITRALIVIHGANRDADNHFRSSLAAGFLAGALSDTVIISPRMASSGGECRDELAPNEVSWTCAGPDRWSWGGPAMGNVRITSFDFVDEILRKLARKEIFPNLKAIVVAGHSAGGAFVTRYEMANQVHEKLGVPVTYVVSNPSTFAYFDTIRPTAAAYPVTAASPGYMPAAPTDAFAAFFDAANCPAYDRWPYSVHGITGYGARLSEDQLKKQLVSRSTTYLLGELEVLPLGGMDVSCAAMAQGPTRLARGMSFAKYLNEKLGAQHKTVIVPLCGHNSRCMFTAEPSLPLLFPKP